MLFDRRGAALLLALAPPPEKFGRYCGSRVERWREVIEEAGIKAE
jgi:hypothetical protein